MAWTRRPRTTKTCRGSPREHPRSREGLSPPGRRSSLLAESSPTSLAHDHSPASEANIPALIASAWSAQGLKECNEASGRAHPKKKHFMSRTRSRRRTRMQIFEGLLARVLLLCMLTPCASRHKKYGRHICRHIIPCLPTPVSQCTMCVLCCLTVSYHQEQADNEPPHEAEAWPRVKSPASASANAEKAIPCMGLQADPRRATGGGFASRWQLRQTG